MSDPKRILIVRPSALGDVCRTVPVLASLRRAYPTATIDWVVQDSFAAAIAAHPMLDSTIAFPRVRFAGWWHRPSVALEMLRWFGDLRRAGYDLVVDCQGLGRSGLMTRLTGATGRVGHRSAREFGWLAYNVRVPGPSARHTVDQMLDLVAALHIEPIRDMRLHASKNDHQWWAGRRESGASPYAVLAPASRWRGKTWPIDCWAQLIGPLTARGFGRVVIVGSPDEVEGVRGIDSDECSSDVILNLVGATSVGQTMAIIAGADLVVANDSAALHMAVGFDRRCLGLFGPTDPSFVGPYRRPEAVLRKYEPRETETVNFKDATLGDSLMRLIEVEDVLKRIESILEQPTVGPDPSDRAPGVTGDAVVARDAGE